MIVVLAVVAGAVVLIHAGSEIDEELASSMRVEDVRDPVGTLADGADLRAASDPELRFECGVWHAGWEALVCGEVDCGGRRRFASDG